MFSDEYINITRGAIISLGSLLPTTSVSLLLSQELINSMTVVLICHFYLYVYTHTCTCIYRPRKIIEQRFGDIFKSFVTINTVIFKFYINVVTWHLL